MAYNGWSNYETWNVALWIDNDEGTYHMRQEWAEEAWADAKPDLDQARLKLMSQIKDFVEENNPLASDASMYADMLGAALSEVDYYEIAENWLEDVEKDEEPEPEEAESK